MEALGPGRYVKLSDDQLTQIAAALRRLLRRHAAAAPAAIPAWKRNTGTATTPCTACRRWAPRRRAAGGRRERRRPTRTREPAASRPAIGSSCRLLAALAVLLAARPPGSRPPRRGRPHRRFLGPAGPSRIRTDLDRRRGRARSRPPPGFTAVPLPRRPARRRRSICPSPPARGRCGCTLRAMARVRTACRFHVGGAARGRDLVPRGPWGRHEVELPPAATAACEAALALRPTADRPRARRVHGAADGVGGGHRGQRAQRPRLLAAARARSWPRSRWPSSPSRGRSERAAAAAALALRRRRRGRPVVWRRPLRCP